jgi:hypothetical protein
VVTTEPRWSQRKISYQQANTVHSSLNRDISVDEGGIATLLDSTDRSYIPGKPHPNCFEFFGASDGFMLRILWEKAHSDQKYARPEKMKALVLKFVEEFDVFTKADGETRQPFVFYLDARFSSIDLMKELDEMGYKAVMSVSSKAKPQPLWSFMKEDLEKRQWRTIYLEECHSTLTTVRAKKKAYVNLLSNHWSARPITVIHERTKPPRSRFFIHCPEVQKRYNLSKNKVDVWNSLVTRYQPKTKLQDQDEGYFKFFVQAIVVNAFVWWKERWSKSEDQFEFRLALLDDLYERLELETREDDVAAHWPGPLKKKKKCGVIGCDNQARSTCKKCRDSFCKKCMDEQHQSLWK